jgi:hypothetical protein
VITVRQAYERGILSYAGYFTLPIAVRAKRAGTLVAVDINRGRIALRTGQFIEVFVVNADGRLSENTSRHVTARQAKAAIVGDR